MAACKIKGFTLIELMIALSVAAILGAFSVSGFNNLINSIRQYNAIQSTVSSLSRTRYLAVKLGQRVALCSLTIDQTCSPAWDGKYLGAFVDANSNHLRDNDEEIIFRQEWIRSMHIRWDDKFDNTAVIYQPNGIAVSNGTIYLTNEKNQLFARLVINNYGRVRFEKP